MDNIRYLHSIAEKRRQHFSTNIHTINGIVITVVLAIGTFLLKGYLDSNNYTETTIANEGLFGFSYFLLAFGLISFILACWRWYVRYLDNLLCNLYPEIWDYEQALGTSEGQGIYRQIASSNKKIKEALQKLDESQSSKLIMQLVQDRRIGRRGHHWFDIIVIIIIVIAIFTASYDLIYLLKNNMAIALVQLGDPISSPTRMSKDISYLLIIIGIGIQLFTYFYFQREPSSPYMKKLISDIKPSSYK